MVGERGSRGMVAPRARLAILVLRVPVGLWGDAVQSARYGGACQVGAVRALAASANRRAARPHSSAAGHAEAMASLMRRTEMRTSAPIFKNLSLMVPQVASAKMVSTRPIRRSAPGSFALRRGWWRGEAS